MTRVACVDVPAVALQLLLRLRPAWRDNPVAVVRDDRPQGEILWVNRLARRCRILPGMTFAAGRNLSTELHAAVVSEDQIHDVSAKLFNALCNFSPKVEPSSVGPGTFWVDPRGLTPLYGSLEQWAKILTADLANRGFQASIVVGFHRYRSYAIARSIRDHRVIPTPRQEARLAARVPLAQLDLSPRLRDAFAVLEITMLGDLLRFSPAELHLRFGEEASRWRKRIDDDHWAPLQPRKLQDPIRSDLQLEPPEHDHTRLLFAFKRLLQQLIEQLANRKLAMAALQITFELDHADAHREFLEPAAPTLDVMLVVELVRLRLESLRLAAGVETLVLEAEGIRADSSQLTLFETRQRRDPEVAARALARIRAMFGPEAVTKAQLCPAHLPEAGFQWQPIKTITLPSAPQSATSDPPLVRRLFHRPVPLPSPPRHVPESWLQHSTMPGTVQRMSGPFRISGGWWIRMVERDYYYVETNEGDLLWVFYDRPRRRWFAHGTVD